MTMFSSLLSGTRCWTTIEIDGESDCNELGIHRVRQYSLRSIWDSGMVIINMKLNINTFYIPKKNVFEKKTLLTRVCNVNRVRWWVLFSLKRQAEMKTMIAENVEYGTTFAHFIAVMKNNTLYFLA